MKHYFTKMLDNKTMLRYNIGIFIGESMISKKDLLKEMNISYGQLYRWKREGLIPDEWFIKQSVSTGQETYFKRDLIIPRIKRILELKETKSIEELKDIFNPNKEYRLFSIRELVLINEIDPLCLKYFSTSKEEFNVGETVMICLFSIYKDDINYMDYNISDFSNLKCNDLCCYITNDQGIIIGNIEYVDKKIQIKKTIKLDEIKKMIFKEV